MPRVINVQLESDAKRFKIYDYSRIMMYALVCRKSGLDCDFIIRGRTREEFLENGANHAIQKHGMHADDIYLNDIPVNLSCHSFNDEA